MNVRALILVVSGLICLFAQFGCKSRDALKSDAKGLSRSPNAKNVAVLFSAPNNLSGPDLDVDLMAKILKDISSDRFKAIKSYKRVNKADVLVKTMQAAREASGGTLFFFFSGHGSEQGGMQAEGGDIFYPSEIVESIKAQGPTKLGRMVFVIDACFSGNLADGQTAVQLTGDTQSSSFKKAINTELVPVNIRSKIADEFVSAISKFNENSKKTSFALSGPTEIYGNLADQVVILTSSNKSEYSFDSQKGGRFTQAFDAAIRHFHKIKGDPTLAQFMSLVSDLSFGDQHPQIRTIPGSLMNSEKLFSHVTEASADLDPTPSPPPPSAIPTQSVASASALENLGGSATGGRQFDQAQLTQIRGVINDVLVANSSRGVAIQCLDLFRSLCTAASTAFRNGSKLTDKEAEQMKIILRDFSCQL